MLRLPTRRALRRVVPRHVGGLVLQRTFVHIICTKCRSFFAVSSVYSARDSGTLSTPLLIPFLLLASPPSHLSLSLSRPPPLVASLLHSFKTHSFANP